MAANGNTIIQWLESWAPKRLAMEWDNIGLQVGTLNKQVQRVMVTLDVLENVVDEAIEKKVDLIIAHHAVIFKSYAHLRTDLPAGRLLEKLIKHDIAVYVAHTNLDVATGGVNDLLAEKIGLEQTNVLEFTHTQKLKKIVVFVPEAHHEGVLQAMSQAGAGWIGNYSHCSFNVRGFGTFMPREGSNPYIGKQGKLEKVEEVRLETIAADSDLNKVIQAMLKAHPYEEVAYDVFPLELEGKSQGIGRIGKLPEPISLGDLAKQLKAAFQLSGLRVVGDVNRLVQKVAVVGGDGSGFVQTAIFRGADVYVTGDMKYHIAHEAMAKGLAIIDPGHHVEHVMKEAVAQFLMKHAEDKKSSIEVLVAKAHTDPFTFI